MSDKKPTSIEHKKEADNKSAGETSVVSTARRDFVRNILVAGGFLAGGSLVNTAFAQVTTTEFPVSSTLFPTTTLIPPTTTVIPPTTTLGPPITTTLLPPTTTLGPPITTTRIPTTTFIPTTYPPKQRTENVPVMGVAGLAALASAIGGTAAYAELKRRGQEAPKQEVDDE